ncbi:unnamed protein product [Sphagnum jensenii]|uniref:Uncharacterized protein n=1 Tax=Sphagnum jensenii TaxID=128206 RepID=A0ABP1ACR2_9BRYO
MLLGVVVLGSHVVALLLEAAGVLAATLSMCTVRRRDPNHKTSSSARKRGAGTQQTDYELSGSAQHNGAGGIAGSSGNGTDGWGSGGGHHGRGSAAAYDDDDDIVAGSADHDGSLDGGGGSGRGGGGAAGVPFYSSEEYSSIIGNS